MKAAVIYSAGGLPEVIELPEPVPQNEDEIVVSVKAVALKHFDKGRARGTHYSAERETSEARIIGGDGVCVLPDGRRVYAIGAGGMMAQRAIVEKDRMVFLPDGLDDVTAAALPNAVFGSAMALRFRAGIEPGDTVLINGATGFTGRVAVQVARHYGAGRIIATGRNPGALHELIALGADETISTEPGNEEFSVALQRIHRATPLNVIIDYLWGPTAECILSALKGKGAFTPRTRFVSVGAVTGDEIRLSAANLRSVDLQLSGSGLGSWTKGQVRALFGEILPEFFQLAAEGKLRMGTVPVRLEEIPRLWDAEIPDGKRIVIQL